jgi:hypothetical protein
MVKILHFVQNDKSLVGCKVVIGVKSLAIKPNVVRFAMAKFRKYARQGTKSESLDGKKEFGIHSSYCFTKNSNLSLHNSNSSAEFLQKVVYRRHFSFTFYCFSPN